MLLVVGGEFGLALLEPLDDRAVRCRSVRAGLPGLGLCGELGGEGCGLLPAQGLEPLQEQRALAVQVDDSVRVGVGGQAPLGVRERRLGRAQPFVEEGAGRGGGLIAALQGSRAAGVRAGDRVRPSWSITRRARVRLRSKAYWVA
nr:hypothetical protein [uncultured Thiodictyon sp.]